MEFATEGPGIGNVLLISKLKQPNGERFAIGRAGVGEKLVNGQEAVLASTIENALKQEQYEAILKRSIEAKCIAPEDGQEIAIDLKNRLKENFPEIQKQNLAFAIVYKDGKPSIIYSFNGLDFPGRRLIRTISPDIRSIPNTLTPEPDFLLNWISNCPKEWSTKANPFCSTHNKSHAKKTAQIR